MTKTLSERTDEELQLVAKEFSEGMAPAMIAAIHGIPPARIREIQTHPRFVAAMRGFLQNQFETELRPVAQKTALDLMRDANTSEMVRARLALGVMDQSRRIEESVKPQASSKTLEQMSPAEIEEYLHQLEAKRADVAKVIEPLTAKDEQREAQNPIETDS